MLVCHRHQQGTDPGQLNVLEGQLTWLVYIVGALIRGRISSASAESQEVIDGEFASRIFQVVQVRPRCFDSTQSIPVISCGPG